MSSSFSNWNITASMAFRQCQVHTLRILMNIVVDCEITDVEISKKIKYLRSQFGEESKKASETKSDEVYVIKWKYYEALCFLQHHLNIKRTATTTNLELVSSTCLI